MQHDYNLNNLLFKLDIKSKNEWIRKYSEIIINRINNPLFKNEYEIIQEHHIIPKCFFNKESDKNYTDNLINLSGEEHFKAHIYLFNYYYKTNKYKRCESMAKSFTIIFDRIKINENEYINELGLLYEENIIKYRELLKENGLITLNEMFKWIKENGSPKRTSENIIEKYYYSLIMDLRQAKKGYGNRIFFTEYQKISELNNNKFLFYIESDEKRILEIIEFYKLNKKLPSRINNKRLSNKLKCIRRNYKKSLLSDEDITLCEELCIENGLDNILLSQNDLNINKLIRIIKFIDENDKKPSQRAKNKEERCLSIKLNSFKQDFKNGKLNKELINIVERSNHINLLII